VLRISGVRRHDRCKERIPNVHDTGFRDEGALEKFVACRILGADEIVVSLE
jgi:hypothetical protein